MRGSVLQNLFEKQKYDEQKLFYQQQVILKV